MIPATRCDAAASTTGPVKHGPSGIARWLCLLLLPVIASPAAACRPAFSDPLRALADPVEGGGEVTMLVLGEVVGARNAGRLERLTQCHPGPTDQEGDRLDCIESFGERFEVEIFPSETLRGSPPSPVIVSISHCSSQAPLLGTRVLAAVFSNGRAEVYAEENEDPGYAHTFSTTYLQQIRLCLIGQCPDRLVNRLGKAPAQP